MAALGLPPPGAPLSVPTMTAGSAGPLPPTPSPVPTSSMGSLGGFAQVMGPEAVAADEAAQEKAMEAALGAQQSQPVISGLQGHIRTFWTQAKTAKLDVEQRMLEAMYARRGQYTSAKLKQIEESKQPAIYMMVAASKMRQIEALLRDILMNTNDDKPWTLLPPDDPDMPPEIVQQIMQGVQQELEQALSMGVEVSLEDVRERLRLVRDQVDMRLQEEAQIRCERMERKMNDQLHEGGFDLALDQFITDFSTFPTAFIKGPIVRKKPKLSWGPNNEMVVTEELSLEWERVDPFNMYPAGWARHISEGPLIEKHKLTRNELTQMIGVEGYSEPAIRKVLEEYGRGGLNDWLAIDSQKAVAEGKNLTAITNNDLIDALQYWGSASGQMLIDWGMDKAQIPDPAKEYQIEAWLIGSYVIKAVLNADPLARRPYYGYSFQTVPGNVWGNSPYDLMHDCQDMCNAAARSLAANLGISSGPQVAIISNRLPAGEDVTDMYPWKIWQFETDPMGTTADPIKFFQPDSNAQELMGVFDKFSQLADEYTGVPRYMAGFNEGTGGAGRTASGMSMMIGNASKIIKQALNGIDINIITILLQRLFYYNMRYGTDPDLKGSAKIVARGALSLAVKEAAQVRRNEFLQATMNPFDMQIMGMEGRAEVLRAVAKSLDMNSDKVVAPVQVLKERQAVANLQQFQQLQQQEAQVIAAQHAAANPEAAGQGGPKGTAPQPKAKGVASQPRASNNRQALMNNAPVSDHFSPA